ncbi:Molybdopterin binding protein, partial [Atractiella rhizophila]
MQRSYLIQLGRQTLAHSSLRQLSSTKTMPEEVKYNWPLSAVAAHNAPLGKGKWIETAACLIIGDEVLNGKTRDTNGNFLAKHLFDLGIQLKRLEVIPDEEEDIVDAVRQMSSKYDLVITSGGVGPTHDDITYQSVARAFSDDGKLVYHDETIKRMEIMGSARYNFASQTQEQKTARLRMAFFPEGAEVLSVDPELWVPVVRVKGKVCMLPGVPRLFQQLLIGLTNYLPLPPASEKPFRHLIHTALPESSIAPFLTQLQERVKKEGVRVGSYPKMNNGVDVSLIGKDEERLRELGAEVCKELQGEYIKEGKVCFPPSRL